MATCSTDSAKRLRDVAIDAALHRLAAARDPLATQAEISRRAEMVAWQGGYAVVVDHRQIASVTLHSPTKFTIDILE